MDIKNKFSTQKKCKAFSTKEFIFFLSILVLLVPLAIYFSAPDNYFSKKSDSSPVIQTFDDERVEQTQKSQANIQLEKKSTSNKKSDFFQVYLNLKRNSKIKMKRKILNISIYQ